MTPIEIRALKLVKMHLRGVVTDRDLRDLRARNAERVRAISGAQPPCAGAAQLGASGLPDSVVPWFLRP
jgi:hypothetical protein